MPRYAKRYRKKKTFRKGRYPRKSIMSMVKSMLPKPEVKKFTLTSSNTEIGDAIPVLASASVTQLTQIAQGDNVNNRQGNFVTTKYIDFRYNINNLDDSDPPAAINHTVQARVMIVQDTQQDASPPIVSQILENVTLQGHINPDFAGRFRILHDKVWTLNPLSSAQGSTYVVRYYKMFKRFPPNSKIVWTSGTATDVSNNNIYLILMRNSDLDTTAGVELGRIAWEFRIGYCDN